MMKNVLIKLTTFSAVVMLCGCSSVMSHTGGKEGTYPGTRASANMLADDDTNWGTKSLVVLDMPFTAVFDTLLLPWDLFRTDKSVRSRVEQSEQETLATNAVIPPAEMPSR
ncbi:YceK/YidQ family lipoprotein [Leclercia adecarboxylata]|uniref:YceK/YidQ family lipoprotein n=1 Tax=Leclercia adecarboxylata TaxID=83655 RepID=UPI002DBC9D06|nr:YceK/YidQ family lipoprotein [Leclercia adecarboxylata]MEB6381128.1 YceK/YidQ family lipoprotein [Leclercia adecarboxylata]